MNLKESQNLASSIKALCRVQKDRDPSPLKTKQNKTKRVISSSLDQGVARLTLISRSLPTDCVIKWSKLLVKGGEVSSAKIRLTVAYIIKVFMGLSVVLGF